MESRNRSGGGFLCEGIFPVSTENINLYFHDLNNNVKKFSQSVY